VRSEDPTRTAEAVVPRLAPGVRLAGRYRIVGLLGVGGMGMVYRAEDEELGLPVAVKILRPDLAGNERLLARFKQELVLARQVSHVNVVRIHDIGSDGGLVFLTMDFVAGRSLAEVLADEGRLAPERAAEIARQLALGLGAAHRAGVVHRDLKPGNVLVDAGAPGSTGSNPERVAITDFGIARSLTGSGLTLPGSFVGTLDYLSPEQARGEEVDGRSDLYALGILLYEMLTGELPFRGGSQAEVLAQRLTGASRDLRRAGVKVPAYLQAIVRRLLEKDPARRYQSAGEVAAALGRRRLAPSPAVRRSVAAAASVLGLLVLGWTAHQRTRLARPGSGPVPVAAAPHHALALLPLADETGRPELAWVADSLPEMLAASLAESRELRVLDSQRVRRTLADLKLPRGSLPEPEARRLASLLDADRLVNGQVHAAGGHLRIDLSLVATDLSGLPAAPIHAEVAEGEAFRLVEQLGGALRQRLAGAQGADEAAAAPAAQLPSRNPAALAAYAQGVASLSRGDALAAVPALERAVASDPGSTAAWVQLARAREALGRREAAREAARRAVESLGPGESRGADEARAVEARLLGRLDRAQEILARLLARYPDDVEARVELAEAYGEQGNPEKASATLAAAVKLAPHHPRAWYLLGRYSIEAGDARRAVEDYLVHALVVQNELGSDQGQAEVLNAFGVAYRALGELERAAENYEQAAVIRRRIGDQRGYATTLRNLANIHLVRGEYDQTEAQLKEALAIFTRLGDPPGIADVENEFGVLAEQRGSYAEALDHYRKALRARRDLGNDLDLAESFGNVGFACYQLGRYDDALVYWRQGLDSAQRSGDPSGIVLATQNLGLLALARGEWDEATKSFLSALEKSRELGMKEATAVSLGHLGRLAQYQGRFGAALASYDEALKVLRELGDRRGLAEFRLAAAETALDLGMSEAADGHLKAAAEGLSAGKNLEQRAELDRLRGEWHRQRGERAAAAAALRRAVGEAAASHSVVELLEARLSAAAATGAGSDLARLGSEVEALGNARLRLRAAEILARAALAAGDPARAETAVKTGLEQAAACGGYAGAWRLHLLAAQALTGAGRAAEAAAERARAAAEVARVSRELGPDERRFFDRIPEVRDLAQPSRGGGA
jgi:eukaryotic-like serine/threonine-protein kinase